METISPRVVYVDDDIDSIQICAEYLGFKNVTVVGYATNGEDGFAAFKEHKPDLIFIDVLMPKSSGFVTLEKIRKIDSKVPIVMVTADLSESTEERLKRLGASKILYKPFEFNKLIDCIEEFVKIQQ